MDPVLFLLLYGLGVLVEALYLYWPLLFGSKENRESTRLDYESVAHSDDWVLIHAVIWLTSVTFPVIWAVTLVVFAKRVLKGKP
ncbi:hypothetical protein SEA_REDWATTLEHOG_95 [Gordonia phage RedWattleHog]|uniref:Uncharacterized protein n=1 Tax=Gordonia phage Stormageddon TaxID=2656541 RepID=A0A649VRY2_9CAUD|nr:hypothetical protein KHQ86_gp208 [Gordonia phage Stormageddon]QGJ94954.1 hypothetical protein SEA_STORMAGEDDON_92 [Gordonia phage Stormageddon]QLF83598.1 hypothetical protein SEA_REDWATTLEHOG_95 [Gordonia phage RedWattleHog]